ncbi:MAG: ADP-ribosylglycohydrolase family protein, partial [Planctomycetota bacterium]
MTRDSLTVTMMVAVSLALAAGCQSSAIGGPNVRRISVEDYVDKMKAGWIGQIPEDKMPAWSPEKINQFRQDDIYVEMTFMRTLELYGLDVSIRQAGIDFANSGYPLWHANREGRNLLRRGIAPPDSGHPEFNKHADDIDYQIEADYAGLIAPGMPNVAIELGEKFGRLMNYGDGLYGGQFVGGMYAEAFFEDDMERIVRAGL